MSEPRTTRRRNWSCSRSYSGSATAPGAPRRAVESPLRIEQRGARLHRFAARVSVGGLQPAAQLPRRLQRTVMVYVQPDHPLDARILAFGVAPCANRLDELGIV